MFSEQIYTGKILPIFVVFRTMLEFMLKNFIFLTNLYRKETNDICSIQNSDTSRKYSAKHAFTYGIYALAKNA